MQNFSSSGRFILPGPHVLNVRDKDVPMDLSVGSRLTNAGKLPLMELMTSKGSKFSIGSMSPGGISCVKVRQTTGPRVALSPCAPLYGLIQSAQRLPHW